MKAHWLTLLCLIPLACNAAGDISKVNRAIHVDTGETVGKVNSVNGSIEIEAGASASDVDTVNGSITIGDRATVGSVETVNGGVHIGEQVKAAAVETVNGALRIGAGAQIAGGVSAINGSISLAKGADIGGRLENVNGRITLDAAHVGGGIETTTGDIEIGADSRVEEGILVKKPRGINWFGTRKRPTIIIGPNAVVQGPLKFEQEVDLYVNDRAQIGPVSGATPIKFSGDQPRAGDRKAAEEAVER